MPSSAMMNGSGGDILSSNGKYLGEGAQSPPAARLRLVAGRAERAPRVPRSLARHMRPQPNLRLVKAG